MTPRLTRRRFAFLSIAAVLGGAGFGLSRLVQRTRDAARRLADL